MRWLCFLLAGSAAAQTAPAKPPRFDLTAIPETRDSFAYRIGGREAGYVVYQYEIVSLETGQELVFTEEVRLGAMFHEKSRVVMNRLSVSGARVYVTRAAPRRIVKLEVLGQPLVSELVASGPVIRSPAP